MVLFFVTKLRTVMKLNSQDKGVIRGKLKRNYHTLKSQYTPWCQDLLCGLSRTRRDHNHKIHMSRESPRISVKEAHFLFSFPITNPSHFGDIDTIRTNPLLGISNSNSFEATNILQTWSFQVLCQTFKCNKPRKGLQRTLKSDFFLTGREQRNLVTGDIRAVRLRPIGSQCAFSNLLCTVAHSQCQGISMMQSVGFFLGLNVSLVNLKGDLRDVQKNCSACRVREGREGRLDFQIKQEGNSATSKLFDISRNPPHMSCIIVDLFGPLDIQTGVEINKTFYLIAVSSVLTEIDVIPMKNYSSAALMLALNTLAIRNSTQFELIISDYGSQLSNWHNQYSEMGPAGEEDKEISKNWFSKFIGDREVLKLAQVGLFVRMGAKRSQSMSKVEVFVHEVKRMLHAYRISICKGRTINHFEMTYFLELCKFTVHSRPILLLEDKWVSVQSLKALLGTAGQLYSSDIGIQANKGTTSKTKKALNFCQNEMNSLKETISVALLCHSSLDNMLNCSTRRERVKHGRMKTTDIQIGDILLDSKHFKTSLSYVGSLVRVIQLTRSNSAALVRRVQPNKSKHGVFPLVTVDRPLCELHFVCRGAELAQGVSFDPPPTFQLSELQEEIRGAHNENHSSLSLTPPSSSSSPPSLQTLPSSSAPSSSSLSPSSSSPPSASLPSSSSPPPSSSAPSSSSQSPSSSSPSPSSPLTQGPRRSSRIRDREK